MAPYNSSVLAHGEEHIHLLLQEELATLLIVPLSTISFILLCLIV